MRAAIAVARRISVEAVIGSRFATTRMPSVPNSCRLIEVRLALMSGGRRELDALGRDFHADAGRQALDAHLGLTCAGRHLDNGHRTRLLDCEQRAGQRDLDLRRLEMPLRRI